MGDISNLLDGEGVNIADVKVNVNRSLAELRLVVEVQDIVAAQQDAHQARKHAQRHGSTSSQRMTHVR